MTVNITTIKNIVKAVIKVGTAIVTIIEAATIVKKVKS